MTDASPCALFLAEGASAPLRVLDFASYWVREVLPRRPPLRRRRERVVLHPPCSARRSGSASDLALLAAACAEDVRVPLSAECCGFGGDGGFLRPEVTAAATAAEAEEIRELLTPGASLYSSSRTCEIGMARASGVPCHSIVQLVGEALDA